MPAELLPRGLHPSQPPLVTMVIPVYKVEAYLRRCLDSVVAQDYPLLDVVVVNDGSPDGCGEIMKEYEAQYPFIRCVWQENRGLGEARNSGIAIARGTYICFVDSDDWIEPDYVSTLVRKAERSHADIAICNFYLDLPVGVRLPFLLMTSRQELTGTEAGRKALDLLSVPTFAWNKLYRRDLFTDVRYPAIYYEDVATATSLLAQADRVVVTQRPLYHYCLRRTGITGSFNVKHAHDYLRAVAVVRDFIWDSGLWQEWGRTYRGFLRRVRRQILVSLRFQAGLSPRERRVATAAVREEVERLRRPPGRPPASDAEIWPAPEQPALHPGTVLEDSRLSISGR